MASELIVQLLRCALLCILTACYLSNLCHSAKLSLCNFPVNGSNSSSAPKNKQLKNVAASIRLDVKKSCEKMQEQKADEANHFYAVGVNESVTLESDVCGGSEEEIEKNRNLLQWSVAFRKDNKHHPLFAFPVSPVDPNWLRKAPAPHPSLKWQHVHALPMKDKFCLTKSGQLHILQFNPEMAGTYRVKLESPTTIKSDQSRYLQRTLHHVDYVYDSEEMFDGLHVRQIPVLAPKVTLQRMYAQAEPNLRYQYRTANRVLRMRHMDASKDPKAGANLYPKETFRHFPIRMMWLPPPEFHQFTQWKPTCGMRINRDRFMRCSVEVDVTKLESWLTSWGSNLTSMSVVNAYDKKAASGLYADIHGMTFMYLLYALVKRLQVQLADEAQENPNDRILYMAGFHWTETDTTSLGAKELKKVLVPCHYTYLHHMPKTTVMEERRASIYIPGIGNVGEREQGVRLCGIADPLELLRMIGQVLVAQLRKLVSMTQPRPVVPKRTLVFRDKTLYLKCPVDHHHFERPVCNVPGKVDTVLWTLNGKTMRFFGSTEDRGPSLTSECALTIRKISYNDAGWYVCYRTPIGSRSVETQPAYRHHVDVVRPDFDPPTVEEVYFGLAVCFAWIGFLLLLWTLLALVRGFLSLLCRDSSGASQAEVWTSFYDNDPALDDFENENDEDDQEEDDEVEEEEDEDRESLLQFTGEAGSGKGKADNKAGGENTDPGEASEQSTKSQLEATRRGQKSRD